MAPEHEMTDDEYAEYMREKRNADRYDEGSFDGDDRLGIFTDDTEDGHYFHGD